MGKKSNKDAAELDLDKIKTAATELSKAIGQQARVVAHEAEDWAAPKIKEAQKWADPKIKEAQKWAEPKMKEVHQWADPKIKEAKKNIVTAAAPRIEAAAGAGVHLVDTTSHKITDDVLPRIQKAMQDAAKAVADVEIPTGKRTARKARKAAHKAEKQLHKEIAKITGKPKRGRRVFGWVVVGTAAAGTGYLLWRRTQPVEDPWAEEYWQNIDSDVTDLAEEAAEFVSEETDEAGATEEATEE